MQNVTSHVNIISDNSGMDDMLVENVKDGNQPVSQDGTLKRYLQII